MTGRWRKEGWRKGREKKKGRQEERRVEKERGKRRGERGENGGVKRERRGEEGEREGEGEEFFTGLSCKTLESSCNGERQHMPGTVSALQGGISCGHGSDVLVYLFTSWSRKPACHPGFPFLG